MKKIAIKVMAIFLVLLFSSASVLNATVYAVSGARAGNADGAAGHALVLESEHLTVTKRKTIQMTATVSNVEVQPQIVWSSSDESIATVDQDGVVKGVSVGEAVIFAKAEVDGEVLQGEFSINVVSSSNFLRDFLVGQQVLSYQYSYVDDYYYTNDKDAWQYNFGFGKIYDFVSPYILLEYDYIRVFFTYENKDWMLQMWKGQYGLIFYGGEIGIYNREHSDEGINEWTMFNCPAEEDWLNMEMTLWHEQLDGTWKREFTRDYDKYWWCTGFKNGHLRREEPANELRLTGRITFKDEEMTKLVVGGLAECGFAESTTKAEMATDGMYVEGNDVYFSWQNISEAESTMAIKVSLGAFSVIGLLPVMPFILPFVQVFALAALLVSVIL